MSEIAMCQGKDCPIRETCFRYKAKPNLYQTYLKDSPYDKETGKCPTFMKHFGKEITCKKCGRLKTGKYNSFWYCNCLVYALEKQLDKGKE